MKSKLIKIMLTVSILFFSTTFALAEDEGITFGLGITGVLQGTLNMDDLNPGEPNKSDFSGSFDFEIESAIGENGIVFAALEAGTGDGLMDEFPFDSLLLGGINDDAGDNGSVMELAEAWYETALRDGQLIVTVGKIDLSAYFDTNEVANDETAQFLASTFVGSPAIEFPDNGLGARATYLVTDGVSVSIGLMEGDADFEDVLSDMFIIFGVDVSREFIPGKAGNYRVFYWLNATDHQHLTQPALTTESGYGFGLSVDQSITDIITAFARVGLQNADVYEVEIAMSFGVQAAGFLPSRPDDVFGFGYAMGITNEDALPGADNESHIEVYYSFMINENIAVTPDIQMVMNPGGDSTMDAAIVFGVRTQVNF